MNRATPHICQIRWRIFLRTAFVVPITLSATCMDVFAQNFEQCTPETPANYQKVLSDPGTDRLTILRIEIEAFSRSVKCLSRLPPSLDPSFDKRLIEAAGKQLRERLDECLKISKRDICETLPLESASGVQPEARTVPPTNGEPDIEKKHTGHDCEHQAHNAYLWFINQSRHQKMQQQRLAEIEGLKARLKVFQFSAACSTYVHKAALIERDRLNLKGAEGSYWRDYKERPPTRSDGNGCNGGNPYIPRNTCQ